VDLVTIDAIRPRTRQQVFAEAVEPDLPPLVERLRKLRGNPE
jgi:hypothetical protein